MTSVEGIFNRLKNHYSHVLDFHTIPTLLLWWIIPSTGKNYLFRNPLDELSNPQAQKRLNESDVLWFHPYRVWSDVDISYRCSILS